jgi:hypothetical protein
VFWLRAGKDMCAGGIQGYRNDSVAITEVLEATISCALNQDCISPEGSNQGNHRFDQSAFSIQMSRGMYRCHSSWLFRAYLEPHRIKEADTYDVGSLLSRSTPAHRQRRCNMSIRGSIRSMMVRPCSISLPRATKRPDRTDSSGARRIRLCGSHHLLATVWTPLHLLSVAQRSLGPMTVPARVGISHSMFEPIRIESLVKKFT